MKPLDPALLARIAGMPLRARTVVEGALSGMHRSPHRGASVEFSEHKEYAPGDELRHVDWRAVGRMDRLYVKQFEHETNLRATIVLDASRSMAYRGRGAAMTKLEVGAVLSASLAYLLVKQGDAAGLLTFADGPLDYLPPRSRPAHLHAVLASLEALRPGSEATDLAATLDRVAEVVPRRGLVVLVSDLLDFRHEPAALLRRLKQARHDALVLQVLDRDELALSFDGPTVFEALEGRARLLTDPEGLRARYVAELEAWTASWRRACVEADADYQLVPTDAPLDRALGEILRRRLGRRRWAF
jgi:uncharacterized protein (DUF58 family)